MRPQKYLRLKENKTKYNTFIGKSFIEMSGLQARQIKSGIALIILYSLQSWNVTVENLVFLSLSIIRGRFQRNLHNWASGRKTLGGVRPRVGQKTRVFHQKTSPVGLTG